MSEKGQVEEMISESVSQNLKKYNQESGKKTLIFMGIIIALIAILSILSLVLMSRPKVLTSSIETELTPTASRPQK